MNIIVEITLFLVVAVVLGFTFGWLISKAMLKEKYEDKLKVLKEKHESEMDAFLAERVEITEKYKELLNKST